MAELKEEAVVFSIDQIPEEQDINDVLMNLMVNPNLAPINYFNDFSDEVIEPDSLSNSETEETGIFCLDENKWMAMTTHAFHHHLSNDPQKATEIIIKDGFVWR